MSNRPKKTPPQERAAAIVAVVVCTVALIAVGVGLTEGVWFQ